MGIGWVDIHDIGIEADMANPGGPSLHKKHALARVFDCLFSAHEPLTKQEISRAADLSLPTVYQACCILSERGLVAEDSERLSTGGRRAATFRIAGEKTGAIGISYTGKELRYTVCDLFGNELSEYTGWDSVRTPCCMSEILARATVVVELLLKQMRVSGFRPVGIGVAIPSAIDPASGKILNTSVMRLSESCVYERDVIDGLSGLGLPVEIFNDANCGAFSQCFPEPEKKSFVYISLERGVGGAVIVDGEPVAGVRGMGGELGHICVEPNGKACGCGRNGCLEAYCSVSALSDEVGCGIDQFFRYLGEGDERAADAFDSYVKYLVRGIQAVQTVLDCPVLLGGSLSTYLAPFIEQIQVRVYGQDPLAMNPLQVRLAEHPRNGVQLGAAQQMVQRFMAAI